MRKSKKLFTLFFMTVFMMTMFLVSGCAYKGDKAVLNPLESPLRGDKQEEYYMVTFLSGLEYWNGCVKGFRESGRLYGVKTVFTGGIQYDLNEEITALEQVISKKPAGIAISCMNPDALVEPINKAISEGIPVVTFDADSPDSKRYSFLGTGNEYAGEVAAKALAEQIGPGGGEVAVITMPSQLNHVERLRGFKKALRDKYKKLTLVQIGNGKGNQSETARVLSGFLQRNPQIKGVFCTDATSGVGAVAAIKEVGKVGKVKIVSFDTDKGTLDGIKSGKISASIAQGTYVMGFQAMNFLFQLKHNLINPAMGWRQKGINPLPVFVDTGVSVVTKKNVDAFYSREK